MNLCESVPGHEVVVEEALPLGEAAVDGVLVLLGQLLLHLVLQPPQQEGPQHLVQPLDEALVVLLRVLHHPRQRVREPLLEVGVRLEAVQASISDRLDLPW